MEIDKLVLTREEIEAVTGEEEHLSYSGIWATYEAISLATVKNVLRELRRKTYGFDDGDGVMVYKTVWEEGEWEALMNTLWLNSQSAHRGNEWFIFGIILPPGLA